MPSSTSNSRPDSSSQLGTGGDPGPQGDKTRFFKALLVSLLISSALVGGWEIFWRTRGYQPTLNDNKDLWASHRAQVKDHPKGTVLIGASRMLFNFNQDQYKKRYGHRPIQLSTVGSSALGYLEDIAFNSQFSGRLIVGVIPGLFFAPAGPPVDRPVEYIQYAQERSLSQYLGHKISLLLEHWLAFIQQEDLTLGQLLKQIPLSNRPNLQIPPQLPPYFYKINHHRQADMIERVDRDAQFRQKIQNIWVPLFTPPPPPYGVAPEQFKKMFMGSVKQTFKRVAKSTKEIEARGGEVIFIRFPSTGKVRELEEKFAPRGVFWDQLLAVTQAKGFHYLDHPTLAHFQCPEWSHLNPKDAHAFTGHFLELLEQAGKSSLAKNASSLP